jgi:hypothetical protein
MWLRSADAFIDKSSGFDILTPIDVAQIDNDRLSHLGMKPLEIKRAKLDPFSDDDQRIGALRARICVIALVDLR